MHRNYIETCEKKCCYFWFHSNVKCLTRFCVYGLIGSYYNAICKDICAVKPRSDIRCNRFATSPRLIIYTNRRGRNKVPDRSRRGCREVGD